MIDHIRRIVGNIRRNIEITRSVLTKLSPQLTTLQENLMPRVRLNLGRLSVTDKITRSRHIISSITNNPGLRDPNPSLSEVSVATDELETAFAQVQAAKSEMSTRVGTQDNAEKKLDNLLTRLGSWVESVAGTDDALITSAGMEIRGSRSAATPPIAPEALAASVGVHEGEIVLSWKAVANAYSYLIESSLDPAGAASWTQVAIATAASKTISGLTSGKRYWFRVKTVGAAGESGWSEHASKVVP
jgi:hypothetical protein